MSNSLIFATHFLLLIFLNLINADEVPILEGIYKCSNGSELNEFMNECIVSPFVITKNNTCSPNSECILKCSVNTSTTIIDHSWIYKYDTLTDDSVKLFTGQFKDDVKNGIYTATINLTNDYYAGSYGCLFEYINGDSASKVVGGFKASQDETVAHDGKCEKSSQCSTLNSRCLNLTNSQMQCACPKDFPVHYTDENNKIIACFKYSEMGENCNIAEECAEGRGNASCINNKCVCFDFVREINGKEMCLEESDMYEFCYLDEQCSRYKHAECVANKCDCPPAYAFIDNQCKLSVASIIFIVVMSLCSLLSLLAIVVCCCKRNRGWGTWIMYILELKPPHQQLINDDKISQIDI